MNAVLKAIRNFAPSRYEQTVMEVRKILADNGLSSLEDCVVPSKLGAKGLVLFARNNEGQEVAVKIPRPSRLISFKREKKHLDRLGLINLETAEVPRLIASGDAPPYLIMTRVMGETFDAAYQKLAKLTPEEKERLGGNIGEFLAELYKKGNFLHIDTNFQNLMLTPNGRLGVIDWADCIEMDGSQKPEMAFNLLMLEPVNLAPAAARRFTELTGIAIDPDVTAQLAREYLESQKPSWWKKQVLLAVIDTNLKEWKSSNNGASRPKLTAHARPTSAPPI